MVANHHYWLHVNTYIHFSHQHVIYVAGSGLNWFWTRTEPSRTGSGRFSSGSGSVHPWGCWFWFWFSKNGLRTELNWTLATLLPVTTGITKTTCRYWVWPVITLRIMMQWSRSWKHSHQNLLALQAIHNAFSTSWILSPSHCFANLMQKRQHSMEMVKWPCWQMSWLMKRPDRIGSRTMTMTKSIMRRGESTRWKIWQTTDT